MDWENETPDGVAQAFITTWYTNQNLYGGVTGKKILSGAPQGPNCSIDTPSASMWGYFNAGQIQLPFPWSGADLSTITPPYLAVTAPALLSQYLGIFDVLFLQNYNNAPQDLVTSPGVLNPIFVKCVAQWAYLMMLSNRRKGGQTKLCLGFAVTTAGVSTPIWVPQNEAILNTAITQINALVSAELAKQGLAQCVPTDWNAGIGFLTSSPANTSATSAYDNNSPLTRVNLGGAVTQLWMEAAYPSPATGWTGLNILDVRPA
jgi:hypothetical protein